MKLNANLSDFIKSSDIEPLTMYVVFFVYKNIINSKKMEKLKLISLS